MSFRSCSTIPMRTGRRCCRNSRPRLRRYPASRRQNRPNRSVPKQPHGRMSCRPQLRQRNGRPSPSRYLRGRRRRSARSRTRRSRTRGIGESLFRAAGDLLEQLAEDGPMSQEEFEAMRHNLSRKHKRRRKQSLSR